MRILGWLAVPGTISAVCWPAERLVRDVLAYRLRCKEIELLSKEHDLDSGSQPSYAARMRRTRRRMPR